MLEGMPTIPRRRTISSIVYVVRILAFPGRDLRIQGYCQHVRQHTDRSRSSDSAWVSLRWLGGVVPSFHLLDYCLINELAKL